MTAVSRIAGWVTGALVLTCIMMAPAPMSGQEPQPDEFHVGDRIALTVEGMPTQAISDTVVVRDGLVLRLPGLGDISLAGVRRADAQKYLTQQIGKFIRDPIVHATPLVRIAVLGQVGHPGFYTVPSDVLLSDVVMRAGGPTNTADMSRTVIKRGNEEVVSRDQVADALSSGLTLDQLHVGAGDQLVVGEKQASSFDSVIKVVGVVVPLLSLALYLVSRR